MKLLNGLAFTAEWFRCVQHMRKRAYVARRFQVFSSSLYPVRPDSKLAGHFSATAFAQHCLQMQARCRACAGTRSSRCRGNFLAAHQHWVLEGNPAARLHSLGAPQMGQRVGSTAGAVSTFDSKNGFIRSGLYYVCSGCGLKTTRKLRRPDRRRAPAAPEKNAFLRQTQGRRKSEF